MHRKQTTLSVYPTLCGSWLLNELVTAIFHFKDYKTEAQGDRFKVIWPVRDIEFQSRSL